MRFIHCADVHLGCKQFGLDERYEDFFSAFSYIIDKTLQTRADALVIAGDLFHQRSIEAFTLERAVFLLNRLKTANIRVFLTEGNHDKQHYADKKSWCAYLQSAGLATLLNAGDAPVEFMGARFAGLGFCGSLTRTRAEECARTLAALPPLPTVLLLHAGVNYMADTDGGLSLDEVECLRPFVNYAALGHIHKPYSLEGWLFNPGSVENVHLSEADYGARGYYDVTLAENALNAKLCAVPTRSVRSFEFSTASIDEIISRLPGGLEGALLRLRLKTPDSVDSAALRKRLAEETGCLYADIAIGMETRSGAQNGLPELDRLESDIISQMAQEYGFAQPQSVSRIIIELKDRLLLGDDAADIANALYEVFSIEDN